MESLEIVVDFKGGGTDDAGVCNLSRLEGCTEVDDAVGELGDGGWACEAAESPLQSEAAGVEVVGRLYQGGGHGDVLLYAR